MGTGGLLDGKDSLNLFSQRHFQAVHWVGMVEVNFLPGKLQTTLAHSGGNNMTQTCIQRFFSCALRVAFNASSHLHSMCVGNSL